jgi:hypothetical protein
MLRTISLLLTTFALGLTGPNARSAHAADDQDRVAIESFRGPHAQRLQGAVETGLMGRYYLVPDFSIEQMARRRGVAMTSPSGMAQVGRALQVRAFLSAEVQKKGAWHVAVVVRSGDTGAPLGRFVVADRRLDHLESTLASRTSRRVGALLARASSQGELDLGTDGDVGAAARVAAPSLAASANDVPDAVDEAGAEHPGEVLEMTLETRVFNRSFAYSQNLSGLADYRLEGALAASLGARFHPLALLSAHLAPLGIAAGLEYGLGVGSRVAGSEQRISTDVHAYSVGLEYRFRLGEKGSTLTPTLGYALSTFNAGQSVGAPNVDYRIVKPGLEARWAITNRLALLWHADYLHVLSSGSLGATERFPRATVRGVESAGSLALAVLDGLEIAAGVGVRRFGIATNVVPGDKAIAGGAVDQTTWLGLGAVYRPSH